MVVQAAGVARRISALALGAVLLTAGCTASPGTTVGPSAIASAGATAAPPPASIAAPTPAPTSSGGRATPTPSASAPAPSRNVVIRVAMTTRGDVLVGPDGLTLYTHAGDSATLSTCTGGCAAAWPPLTIKTGFTAIGGPSVSGTFGTLLRANGTIQVTYRGRPLYYWQGDMAPGETTGQGINGFSVARP